MTKITALLLCLAFFITPVFAVEVDVLSLTDDDLSYLYEAVIDEMNRRSVECAGEIYPSTYIVGVDILPGKYVLQYLQNNSPVDGVVVRIYANQTDYDSYHSTVRAYLYDYQELLIDLQDGMILDLENASLLIRTIPTPFWAVKK